VTTGISQDIADQEKAALKRLRDDHPQPIPGESVIIVVLMIGGGNEILVCPM
jgi:hypothetical protein